MTGRRRNPRQVLRAFQERKGGLRGAPHADMRCGRWHVRCFFVGRGSMDRNTAALRRYGNAGRRRDDRGGADDGRGVPAMDARARRVDASLAWLDAWLTRVGGFLDGVVLRGMRFAFDCMLMPAPEDLPAIRSSAAPYECD